VISKSPLPSPTVSGYVNGILVIENIHQRDAFTIPLYANGSPTLVFQTVKATKQNQTVGHLTLYGQTIRPDELIFHEAVTLIAYFFYPHSLKSLFGFSANELTDCSIDLNFFKQSREINLADQLLNANSLKNRLLLIDRFILKLASSSNIDTRKIFYVTNELRKNYSIGTLADIQTKLNTTERSLQRLFETHVGISPKMFNRICQFQSAFQQLNQYQFSKLSDLAFENGFSDQSHFIRVFKEFTGITPKEYIAKMTPYNPKF
jgi:AraC-like DNA-binding protein